MPTAKGERVDSVSDWATRYYVLLYEVVSVSPSKLRKLAQVSEVFTPGTPISRYSIFAGRMDQIMEIVNATSNRGQHVVMYGERGVGKTSLANVLTEIFDAMGRTVLKYARINCNSGDDFSSIWRNVGREIDIEFGADPYANLTPEDIRFGLSQQSRSLIVLDELDRFEDDDSLTLLADTIKSLSDHSIPATVVLVGVADSIEQLLGDHASIERNIVQVPMPRMREDELTEIVDNALQTLGMSISDRVKARIPSLSEGLPHYTHLLGLHAFQRAIQDDRSEVNGADVDAAIRIAVEKAQHSIRSAYQRATRSPHKDNLFAQVLLACALAPKDELGYFAAGAVRIPMSQIMGRPYEIPAFARHLDQFTKEDRGYILSRRGPERMRFYRFENPMLQPFVILSGLSKGYIREEQIGGGPASRGAPDGPPQPDSLPHSSPLE